MATRHAARRWRRIAARWPLILLPASLLLSLIAPVAGAGRWWVLGAWLPAAATAAAGLLRRRRDAPRSAVPDAGLLLLAASLVRPLAAAAGVDPLALAPLYGALVVVAAARFPRWWAPLGAWAAAAAFEAGHLGLAQAAAGDGGSAVAAASGSGLAVSLGALAALAGAAAFVFERARRSRAELDRDLEEHRRRRSEAEEYGALAEHRRTPTAEDLTVREREARIRSVLVALDRDLDRLLGLGRLAVGARGLFLFLLDADAETLALRRAAAPEEGPPPNPEAAVRAGEGVVGHAARTRRSALFSSLDPQSVGARLWADGTPLAALLVVPVLEDGVFRGLLVAEAGTPEAFGRGQELLLERFAEAVGAALAGGRADGQREWRGHRFESLAIISQALSSTIRLDEMLATMVDLTKRVIPYDRSAFFIADPPARRLHLRAWSGFEPPPGREVILPYDQSLAGFIALQGRELLYTNLRKLGHRVDIVPGTEGEAAIQCYLGLPVRHRNRLVGVWVLAAAEPGRFDADHLDVLKVIAAEAAVLIANAELHATVERMAVTDGLTGLHNHRHFQERLEHEVARAGRGGDPLSLLLLDIDHFKRINDTHGHPFGDTVLRALAAALGGLARRVDLVARYGGEEFAIVLVGTDRDGCRRTAERVLRAVRAIRVPREGEEFSFTASVGTATWPGDGQTREELVRAADRALYAAKHGGRDRAIAHGELAGGAGR